MHLPTCKIVLVRLASKPHKHDHSMLLAASVKYAGLHESKQGLHESKQDHLHIACSREKVRLTGELSRAYETIARCKANIQETVRLCEETPGLAAIPSDHFDEQVASCVLGYLQLHVHVHACIRV